MDSMISRFSSSRRSPSGQASAAHAVIRRGYLAREIHTASERPRFADGYHAATLPARAASVLHVLPLLARTKAAEGHVASAPIGPLWPLRLLGRAVLPSLSHRIPSVGALSRCHLLMIAREGWAAKAASQIYDGFVLSHLGRQQYEFCDDFAWSAQKAIITLDPATSPLYP